MAAAQPGKKRKTRVARTAPAAPSLPRLPRVGTLMVCPPHGVGEVDAIRKDRRLSRRDTFLCLNIIGRNLRVLIPARRVSQAGLRDVIRPGEVETVRNVFRKQPARPPGAAWSKWQQECLDKLNSGSIYLAAEVLRDLAAIKADKGELSMTQTRLLDIALRLVATELALVTRKPIDDVEVEIFQLLLRRRK